MKLRSALAVFGLLAALAAPASAQITDIDDIQVYNGAGDPVSPFDGSTVTVRGVITAIKGTWNGGTHYIQDATGGINFFDPGAPSFLVGQEVEVTGTVTSFGGEINLGNLNGPFIYTVLGNPGEPAPIEYTISEFVDNDGSGTLNSADFEILGWLAAIEGEVVYRPGIDADPNFAWDQGTFGVANASGDTATVFIDRTTGITTGSINSGDQYRVVGPVSVFGANLQVKPRQQTDLIENPGDPFPQVSGVTPSPWTPEASDPVTVTATIVDDALTTVNLYYRDRGAPSFTSVPMINLAGDLWSGSLPGTTADGIDYYIEATDSAAQTTLAPGDAPAGFFQVAVGTTSIVDIQSTLQAGTDASAFSGQIVNVEAIVTAAPGQLQDGGFSNYAVGEAAGGPWSGIFVFEGSGANTFFRGDVVRISGLISEFSGITEILPQSGSAIELVSFGAPLPPVTTVGTDELNTTEEWESVIVKTTRAAVIDTVAGGAEWLLQDSAGTDSLYVDPAPAVSIIAELDQEMSVTGLLDTRFARNEVVPLSDGDIVIFDATSAPGLARIQSAQFESIAPNPFNPRAEIKFSVAKAGMVELAVFDTRGRRVSTLVGGPVEAGDHTRVWSGVDDDGQAVSSGVYYARLRFGGEAAQVQKLTLTK